MTQQVLNSAAYAPAAGYWPGGNGQAGQYAQPDPYARFRQYPHAVGYQPAYARRPATNGLAIAALVLGVVSALGAVLGVPLVVFAVLGAPAGIVGLVLGVVARGKVRERQQQGAGMALAGILTAAISLAVDLLIVGFFVVQILILFFG